MTDKKSNKSENNDTVWYKRLNKRVVAVVAAFSILAGGAIGVQALTHNNAFAHMKLAASGDGWRGGKWHRASFSKMSESEIEDRVSRIVKHVAIEIDADEDQQKKITSLIVAAAKQLQPLRQQYRASGEELKGILLADNVDRTRLETLRAERFAQADQISKNMMTALADISEVLTPKQRLVLNERIEEFRSKSRRWRRH